MHTYYNELEQWSADNFMQSTRQRQQMVIGKRTITDDSLFTPNYQPIDKAEEFKILWIWVSANLTCNKHVDQMISKATSRFYYLKQTRKASAPPEDMLLFYTGVIHSVLEYAAPVWHSGHWWRFKWRFYWLLVLFDICVLFFIVNFYVLLFIYPAFAAKHNKQTNQSQKLLTFCNRRPHQINRRSGNSLS